MTLWNAEGLKPIGYLVWPLRSLKVRNPFLTVTWPGDLTFGDLGLKFLHKVSNSIVSRYWKNGGAALRRFSAIREKPEGWAFPPPPVRVLNWGRGLYTPPPIFYYIPTSLFYAIKKETMRFIIFQLDNAGLSHLRHGGWGGAKWPPPV